MSLQPPAAATPIQTSAEGRETYEKFYDEFDQRSRGGDEAARAFFRPLPAPA